MAPKESSKVFVINPFGEVLYTQRSPFDDSRPAAFDLPGGGLKSVCPITKVLETPEAGGVREVREEVSLDLNLNDVHHIVTTVEKSKRFGHSKVTHYFATWVDEVRPELRLDKNEVQWAGWGWLGELTTKLGREDQRYAARLLLERPTILLGV